MIQILYTADHLERGAALASEIGAQHGLISITPVSNNLHTLIFWGHGDSYNLCKKTASEIKDIVSEWKKKNPTLHTVEILTCNARHAKAGLVPFANELKSKLNSFFGNTKKITLKALPTNVNGKHGAHSVLLADAGTRSWCYVTATGADDKKMWEGASKITFHEVGGKSVSYKGNVATRANMVASKNPDRQFTLNYGSFSTLRNQLVEV